MLFSNAILLLSTVSLLIGGTVGQRPNFVFIFTDDVGFGDLACYGHPYARTNNIDRLAAEGTLFRQFHVNGNICPITRTGIMTGRNPAWFPNYPEAFGFKGALTITNLLQEAGYRTGHVGKWNIGPNPQQNAVEYGIDDLRYYPGSPFDPEGRERRRFDEAMDFIETNRDVPFYLNLWLLALHTPIVPPQSFVDQFAGLTVNRNDFGPHMQPSFDRLEAMGKDIDDIMRRYLADLLALDVHVGRLLDKLDELGIADNTIVVFSSDNGPADVEKAPGSLGYAGELRGGKHNYYEGGTRVPFLVRWPGKVPAGRVDDHSIMFGTDWLTTVCSLAGAPYPQDLFEGEDMSDVWLGNVRPRTNPLFFRVIADNGRAFIRYGRWKLHQTQRELYDLESDPAEMVNLYGARPDIISKLSASVDAWKMTLPSRYSRSTDSPLPFDPMEPVALVEVPDIPDAFPSFPGPVQSPTNSPIIQTSTPTIIQTPTPTSVMPSSEPSSFPMGSPSSEPSSSPILLPTNTPSGLPSFSPSTLPSPMKLTESPSKGSIDSSTSPSMMPNTMMLSDDTSSSPTIEPVGVPGETISAHHRQYPVSSSPFVSTMMLCFKSLHLGSLGSPVPIDLLKLLVVQ